MLARQTTDDNLIAQLARLTDEEQAIYRRDYLDRSDLDRLRQIEQDRAQLYALKNAQRIGFDLSSTAPPVVREAPDRSLEQRRPDRDRHIPRDLPKGVERMASGRIRAVCYLRWAEQSKISLGTFEDSDDQIALAGRIAAAARAKRDAGGSMGEIQAAAFVVYQEEHGHAAD